MISSPRKRKSTKNKQQMGATQSVVEQSANGTQPAGQSSNLGPRNNQMGNSFN